MGEREAGGVQKNVNHLKNCAINQVGGWNFRVKIGGKVPKTNRHGCGQDNHDKKNVHNSGFPAVTQPNSR